MCNAMFIMSLFQEEYHVKAVSIYACCDNVHAVTMCML